MVPADTATDTAPTVTVRHGPQRLQVHVATYDPREGNHEEGRPHLHVQDLAGGAGRVVPLTRDRATGDFSDPLVRELAGEHSEVAELVRDVDAGTASAPGADHTELFARRLDEIEQRFDQRDAELKRRQEELDARERELNEREHSG